MNNSLLNYHQIPYDIPAEVLFEAVRDMPQPVFLDSNQQSTGMDIVAANPYVTIKTVGEQTSVVSAKKTFVTGDCPFQVLRNELNRFPQTKGSETFPFNCGAIGYFGYDLSWRLEQLPRQTKSDIAIPEMDVGIYLWALVRDHNRKRSFLVARPECNQAEQEAILERVLSEREQVLSTFSLKADFVSNMSQEEYSSSFQRIHSYIKAGDCYQVNFAQRFEAPYEGDIWQAYLRLKNITDGSFSAFIEGDGYALLSLSPERFIQVRDRQVETKPIKGTRPRSKDQKQDQQFAQLLRNSPKDQAENLMIVDLLRNDISKNCNPGSVTVPKLFDIESYSNVHHMVSTIRGKLAPGRAAIDLLRDAFPGGSITGAPKLRAMEIIEELENQRRTVYCGSIGYIDFNGNMDTSIAIRTLVCHNQMLYCWGGGGIVSDSDVDNEYQESIVKIGNLLDTLKD